MKRPLGVYRTDCYFYFGTTTTVELQTCSILNRAFRLIIHFSSRHSSFSCFYVFSRFTDYRDAKLRLSLSPQNQFVYLCVFVCLCACVLRVCVFVFGCLCLCLCLCLRVCVYLLNFTYSMCDGVCLSIKYPVNAQSGLVIILIVTLCHSHVCVCVCAYLLNCT